MLDVPIRTLQRWGLWWREQFPLSALWQAMCARFMPPVVAAGMPAALLARFTGAPASALLRMLVFLSPLRACLITTNKAR